MRGSNPRSTTQKERKMSDVYYVANWPYHEHPDMGRIKTAKWVKAKVQFDGPAWLKIAESDDPCAVLATWEVVRGLALLSPYRGILVTDEVQPEPYTPELIAQLTRLPCEKIRFGMCFLTATVQWLGLQRNCNDFATLSSRLWRKRYTRRGIRKPRTRGKTPHNVRTNPAQGATKNPSTEQNITVQNRTGQDTTNLAPPAPESGTSHQAALMLWGEFMLARKKAHAPFPETKKANGVQAFASALEQGMAIKDVQAAIAAYAAGVEWAGGVVDLWLKQKRKPVDREWARTEREDRERKREQAEWERGAVRGNGHELAGKKGGDA